MSFMSRILHIQFDILLIWQSFLFWNQISYFKGHVYSSLIVEMKSERCQIWKRFWKSSFFDKKKSNTSHSNTQSFNCLVFWKQKVTRCKIKMVFSWFFVSILKSDFGYIFWWSVMTWHCCEFQKQDAQALSRKVVSFLSIYFINMHNNQ